jgi:hypothetical protein
MATSKFSRWFHVNGQSLVGANIWLVPQANNYPTNAIQLVPHASKEGVYEYDNLEDGEYKIYIDTAGGTSPTLNQEEFWVGEQRITDLIKAILEDVTTYNVSAEKHGLVPKLPDDETKFLNGKGEYVVPPISGSINTALDYEWKGRQVFSKSIQLGEALRVDINTAPFEIDVSNRTLLILKPTVATQIIVSNPQPTQVLMIVNRGSYIIGWPNEIIIPANTMALLVYNQIENKWYVDNIMKDFWTAINYDVTTYNASATKHGLLPKLPNDETKFLNGKGEFVELASFASAALVPLLISGWYNLLALSFGPSGIVLAT